MSTNEAGGRPETAINLETLGEQNETVTKRIKESSIPAHKAIACTGSPYFKTACSNPAFIEYQGTIKIEEPEPMFVKKVLSFLYTDDYDFAEERKAHMEAKNPQGTKRSGDGDPIEAPVTNQFTEEALKLMETHPAYLHYRVFAEADYFMVDNLMKKAGTYFKEALRAKRIPVDTFMEMIREIWTGRPNFEQLKEEMVAHCVRNLRYYQRGRQPLLASEFLKERPEFASALCLELSREHLRVLDGRPGG
ncbi:hypothetical protein N7540_008136 [Penicillium herquei]|nr:hypothetical protein N7540_008136 [Penicillium herquei]